MVININRQTSASGEAEALGLALQAWQFEPSSPSVFLTVPTRFGPAKHTPGRALATPRDATPVYPPAQTNLVLTGIVPEPTLEKTDETAATVFGQVWDDEAIEDLDAVFEELGSVD